MTVNTEADFEISAAIKSEIDHWVTKYPKEHKRSAVTAALLAVQAQNGGWLSDAAMRSVASYLDLPLIVVREVASFYDLFELAPVGKHRISVCTNLSCMLRGSDKIVAALKDRLGIGLGETTPDGQITLRESECLAACGGAPMCQVNNQAYHENLTPESMVAIVDGLLNEAQEGSDD